MPPPTTKCARRYLGGEYLGRCRVEWLGGEDPCDGVYASVTARLPRSAAHPSAGAGLRERGHAGARDQREHESSEPSHRRIVARRCSGRGGAAQDHARDLERREQPHRRAPVAAAARDVELRAADAGSGRRAGRPAGAARGSATARSGRRGCGRESWRSTPCFAALATWRGWCASSTSARRRIAARGRARARSSPWPGQSRAGSRRRRRARTSRRRADRDALVAQVARAEPRRSRRSTRRRRRSTRGCR